MPDAKPSAAPTSLRETLRNMVVHPVATLVPPWSWKAAALSGLVRSTSFLISNLRSGPREAVRAMVVEAVFATFAGGLIGAISQQLRRADPIWATTAFVWLGMPAALVLAQLAVHRVAHTPHLTGGLITSFLFTALCAAYSWYAMRHGAMLGGTDETTVRQDLKTLPGITWDFIMAVPRLLRAGFDGK